MPTIKNDEFSDYEIIDVSENRAKKIMEAVHNETCTKILNAIKQKPGITETQIAKKLTLPNSTVHYAIGKLMSANLIEDNEYHYSTKGKKVNHYTTATKTIIITPNAQSNIMQRLKAIIPAIIILAILSLILQNVGIVEEYPMAMQKTIPTMAENRIADAEMALMVSDENNNPTTPIDYNGIYFNGKWMMIGAVLAFAIYLLITLLIQKINWTKFKKNN